MANLNRIQVATLMEDQGMVPLFFHPDIDICKKVIQACYDGGSRLLEFTNRGMFAHEVFSALSKYVQKELPGMALGVGSVTDAASASVYMHCGASFVVTPAFKEDNNQSPIPSKLNTISMVMAKDKIVLNCNLSCGIIGGKAFLSA